MRNSDGWPAKAKTVVIIGIILALSGIANAREWAIVGPRALGMGGAHVAVSNDSTASYWNPAAFGFFGAAQKKSPADPDREWSSTLSGGISASVHEGLGKELDKILDYDYDALDNGQISAANVDDYIEIVNSLKTFNENNKRAVKGTIDGQLGIQLGNFGIAGILLGEISAKGKIDTVNIVPETGIEGGNIITYLSEGENLNSGIDIPAEQAGNRYWGAADATRQNLIASIEGIGGQWDDINPTTNNTYAYDFVDAVDYGLDQVKDAGGTIPAEITDHVETVADIAESAATGGSLEDNESVILFKGLMVTEVPITYGQALDETCAIGGNIKYMKGRTYNAAIKIFDTKYDDALDKAQDDYTESSAFGLDLGILYRIDPDIKLGFVGRNLNSPEFDMKPISQSDQSSIEEKPQIRAGIAYTLFSFITLAADYDITENDTTVSGYQSKNMSLGSEISLWKMLALRFGGYKNIAEDDIGWVYTGGIGLNLFGVSLDGGIAIATDTETIDEKDIPKEMRGELALSMLF
ncbi:MAG: conjugal transfer protein TraF [Pseudomonadota bacterium]